MKKLIAPTLVKFYIFSVFLLQFIREVSVGNVLENAPFADPARSINFFANAFWGTERVVQIVFLGLVATMLFLARDIFIREKRAKITFA
jgi:hypothetical protein